MRRTLETVAGRRENEIKKNHTDSSEDDESADIDSDWTQPIIHCLSVGFGLVLHYQSRPVAH